jgi:hypothetical protein
MVFTEHRVESLNKKATPEGAAFRLSLNGALACYRTFVDRLIPTPL